MHLNVPTVDHSILLSKFLLRYPRSSGFLRTFVELRVQTKQIESYSSVKRVGSLKAPCYGYYFLLYIYIYIFIQKYIYLTIILRGRAGYEMIYNQRGA